MWRSSANYPDIWRRTAGIDGNDDSGDALRDQAREEKASPTSANHPILAVRDRDAVVHSSISTNQLSLLTKDKSSQTIANIPNSRKGQTSSAQRKKKKLPASKQYDADMPVIITLFGDQQTAAVSHLKGYIGAEASDKHDVIVGRNQIQAMTAKGIPEQTHSYDCGVCFIAYIEEFAKNPAGFVTKILTGSWTRRRTSSLSMLLESELGSEMSCWSYTRSRLLIISRQSRAPSSVYPDANGCIGQRLGCVRSETQDLYQGRPTLHRHQWGIYEYSPSEGERR